MTLKTVKDYSKQRTNKIIDLPPELLIKTFQTLLELPHTKPADLLQCALVCRSWHYHALKVMWHRPIILKPHQLFIFSDTLSTSTAAVPYPLFIRRINLTGVPDFVTDHVLDLLAGCHHLERLTMTGCSQLTNRALIDFFQTSGPAGLLSLDLSELSYLTDALVMTVARHCQKLQGLNLTINPVTEDEGRGITDQSIVVLAEHCRELRRVRLSNWRLLSDSSIFALADNCKHLLEIDVGCSITNASLIKIVESCRELRELKLNHCQLLNDGGFLESSLIHGLNTHNYEQLRVLELTNVMHITDRSLDCLTRAAPKIRNLVLNKCFLITDQGVDYIGRLGRALHYLHLGGCRNITNQSIVQLTTQCTRLRYIDLASCHQLGDRAVKALATLPKIKRIGLVKCYRLTDDAVWALLESSRTQHTLERLHLSYCEKLSVEPISMLVVHFSKLTHLSLSFIPAFQHDEYQRFGRAPPKDYNAEVRSFCVFSGPNIDQLRNYFVSPEFTQSKARRLLGLPLQENHQLLESAFQRLNVN